VWARWRAIGRFSLEEARGWHGFYPRMFRLHAPANTPIEARFTWGKCQFTGPVWQAGKSADDKQPCTPRPTRRGFDGEGSLQGFTKHSMNIETVLW